MTNITIKAKYLNYWWDRLEKSDLEVNCIKFLLKRVRRKDTILEIGAFIGIFTLLLSNLVGQEGKVHAFEPDLKAISFLEQNVKRNHIKNTIITKTGLSNKVGNSFLYYIGKSGNSASTLTPFKQKNVQKQVINVTTIDKFCKVNNIVPNGIKIDVEGAENLVLQGGQEIIKKYKPWILLEFHGIFMSEEQRLSNWRKIIENSIKVVFVDGDSKLYDYGDVLDDYPDCDYFHVFIEY